MTNSQNQQNSVSVDQAKAILQFLQRTQMQGSEMPAYVDVFNTLSAIVGTEPQQNDATAKADASAADKQV